MSKVALVTDTKSFLDKVKENVHTALVIKETSNLLLFNTTKLEEVLSYMNPYIASRDICETDANTLQLLPYVILRHKENGIIKYFTYQRGKAGQENRLHANYSIGVGGHIETDTTDNNEKYLAPIILQCALREVFEEVGIQLDISTAFNGLIKCVFIYDTSNDVGKVHLGIAMFVDVSDNDISSKEPGVIDNVSWNTEEELKSLNLENWSRILVEDILPISKALFI